jgi:MFS family permease
MTFTTGAFYGFLAGAPRVARGVLELKPTKLGFYMGTVTAGFLVGSFLSGRYANRYALPTMMIAGRLVACGGLLAGIVLLLTGHVNGLTLFGATACAGIGNGLTMPSSTAGAVSVRPELAGSASGLAGALTVGMGALLTSITGAVMTEGEAAYQLLGIMLVCSAAGTVAALFVWHADCAEAGLEQEG